MTTKLALYNKAGGHLTQERMLDLTDDTLLKRELDAVYDDTIKGVLEEGLWKIALRSVFISADPSIDTTTFGGRKYGYSLPSDFVRIANVSRSPYFTPNSELDDYELEGPGKLLYSDSASFYLRYVSNDASYGFNLALWSETLAEGTGYRLAEHAAMRVTKSSTDRDNCKKLGDIEITKAKIRDAVDDRVKEKPTGRLVRARGGYGRLRRGSRTGGIWD